MVILQEGENIVCLTLSEKVTIANPIYLFALSSIQTNNVVYFIASDVSSYPGRYNKFIWNLKTNPNPNNGEFDLPVQGLYTYTAYQLSTPQLTPPEDAVVLEIGNVQFGYTEQSLITYPSPSSEIKIYG